MKKFMAFIAAMTISIGCLSGCSVNTNSKVASLWTTDATKAVFQNKSYEGEKGNAIQLSMAKNEYEGAQIHINAAKTISAYDIKVTDLYSDVGVIPKENIDIYAAKYTVIDRVASEEHTRGNVAFETEVGDCIPDALVPFSALKDYKENCIEKGKNQSIFLSVYTDAGTPSGEYQGKVILTLDGETKYVDVTCTVWDFVLPSQTEFQNYWGLFDRSEWGGAELDSSPEMAQKYFEFGLKYRINGDILNFDGTGTAEDYVELIRAYWNSYGFSSYRFWYEYKHSVYDGMSCDYNAQKLKEYLIAVAKASAEDKVDYLSKAYFYFSAAIDEPPYNTTYEECEEVHRLTKELLKDVNEEMKVMLAGTDGYGFYVGKVENSLLNIPNFLTAEVRAYLAMQDYDAKDFNYCFSGTYSLSQDIIEAEHAKNNDVWWYQNPLNYIDAGPIYSRVVGWVAKANNVDGFLNWNACIHVDDKGYYFFNPYVQSEVYKDAFYSGNGYVMYPGRQYGIDGPIPSLRLMNYRDAMEDVSYIEALEKCYEEKGLSANLYLNEMYIQLYNGGKILAKENSLIEEFKSTLAEEIVSNAEKLIHFGDAVRKDNIVTVSFAVSDKVKTVKYQGEIVPIVSGVNTIDVDVTENAIFALDITLQDGSTQTITQSICGEFALVDDFENVSSTVFKTTSDGSMIINDQENYSIDGNSLKICLKGSKTDITYRPGFYFNTASLGETQEIDELSLNIYNANEEITFAVYFVIDGAETLYREITLKEGWNYFTIYDFYSYATEGLTQIRFRSENFYEEDANGNAKEKVFYLDTLSIVKR